MLKVSVLLSVMNTQEGKEMASQFFLGLWGA